MTVFAVHSFRQGCRAWLRVSIAGLALVGLVGCGASNNSAPIVYGTEPAKGRIYNSPAEIYLDRPSRVGAIAQTDGPTVLSQSPLDYAGSPQPVRIYDRPPSAGASPAPVRTYEAAVAPTRLAPVPVSGTYADADIQEPVYRGLPPAPSYRSVPPEPQQPYRTSAQTAGSVVTVAPGDTVFAIARRTGVAPRDIIAANDLRPPYNLAIGQRLVMPSSVRARSFSVSQPASAGAASSLDVPSAPVASRQVIARDRLYTVRAGDTLFGIAGAHGIAVDAIMRANRIGSVRDLEIGRQLLLPGVPTDAARPRVAAIRTPAPQQTKNAPARKTAPPKAKSIEGLTREASYTVPSKPSPTEMFDWPVKGSVIAAFGTGGIGRRNDGINIAAPAGATVRAATDGEVVYRGAELDGYGNLLLIKHNGGYVTAYAHNDVMLVRKGQRVKKGQIIAKVGSTGAVNEPQLHFEIRHNLKSIDPMGYLEK